MGTPESEHDVCGLRVDIHVELRRGSDISALEIGTRHHHDAADAGGDVGRLDQGHGEIGHGGKGHDVHFAGLRGAQRLHDEVHSVLLARLRRRRRQDVSIQAGRAVHVVGDDQLAPDGLRTSGEHGNVCAVRELQNLERVDDGVVEPDIACCGHQAQDLKGLGRGQHHHDGCRFVLPGVGGNDHLGWHPRILSD